ncbi:MAG TPA: hypothetical protein VGA01_04320 [Candidatus Binatia bacterium]
MTAIRLGLHLNPPPRQRLVALVDAWSVFIIELAYESVVPL